MVLRVVYERGCSQSGSESTLKPERFHQVYQRERGDGIEQHARSVQIGRRSDCLKSDYLKTETFLNSLNRAWSDSVTARS